MKKQVRILIVDDHFILRMGLIASLKTDPELAVVGEADNGRQALQMYRQKLPDVVLMDLRLPDMSGVEATAAICKEFPRAKVMILTSHDLEEDIFRAFQAGALGYLLKDVQVEVLAKAIKSVAGGNKHIPPEIARALAEHGKGSDLTGRELQVLQMVVKGLSNREIGSALGFSENTAKFHVKNILTKLQVADRTEAATAAWQRGILR
jgi:two-component system, NarL family, response regulator